MPPKNKGGRPRIDVDLEQLQSLVEIQCTAEECAHVIGCSVDTIDKRLKEAGEEGFAEYYKRHASGGKVSLRRAQWKSAMGGNVTMQIWLGKQTLGQTDKSETEVTSPDGSMTPVSQVVTFQLPDNGRG
ncbi:hypothetical protein QEZ52_00350 [Aliisedimentitalea scapharcae]|uniref:Uncharacterized protein n=1 Tax=Aliisedimentitalea scapharcae TaxID=1524259 RepID=A0ABZ2XUM6_9RHOB